MNTSKRESIPKIKKNTMSLIRVIRANNQDEGKKNRAKLGKITKHVLTGRVLRADPLLSLKHAPDHIPPASRFVLNFSGPDQ